MVKLKCASFSFERLCHLLFRKPYLKHFFSAGNARCLLLILFQPELTIGSRYTGTNQQGAFHCKDDGALCAGRLARYVSGSEEGLLSVLIQTLGSQTKASAFSAPRLTTTQRMHLSPKRQKNITVIPLNKRSRRSISL